MFSVTNPKVNVGETWGGINGCVKLEETRATLAV